MTNKKLIILRGLPCSGKSTFAKEQVAKHDAVRVNRDDIREMLHCSEFTNPNEHLTNQVRDYIINLTLQKDRTVVSDDTNLRPKVVRGLKKIAGPDCAVEEIFFDISPEEAKNREAHRQSEIGNNHIPVPDHVIDKMWADWQGWKDIDTSVEWGEQEEEEIQWIEGIPSAIMCDLDGTLAHMVARGPYDHMKCDTDVVDQRVANMLDLYYNQGFKTILMSGRDGESREITEFWLAENNIYYDALHMRAAGDQRKDSIIKNELFDAHVRGQYNVHFVLDDRNQVVNEWRRMGLVCYQVADGDF